MFRLSVFSSSYPQWEAASSGKMAAASIICPTMQQCSQHICGYFNQFDTFCTTRRRSVWLRRSNIYRASRRFKFRLVEAEIQMWCCSLDRVACFHVDSKRMWPLKPKVWHLALEVVLFSGCSKVVWKLNKNNNHATTAECMCGTYFLLQIRNQEKAGECL